MISCGKPGISDEALQAAKSTLRSDGPIREIKRIHAKDLTYDRFFLEHLVPNVPVVIEGIADHFTGAAKLFTRLEGSKSVPELEALEAFSDSEVQVADCNSRSGYEQPRETRKFSEFIRYWRQLGPVDSRSENDSDEILYVKDWHFVREYPSSGLYQLPIVFGEDWINDWWDLQKEKQDDYRFVYMGPKESWTPLHADVFRSYSWSYNVCGAKKWILFPPSDEPFITNRQHQYHFDVRVDPNPTEFPNWNEASPIQLIQREGEVIFVPSKWHHQVHNIEDTISINHNWGNACNLEFMLEYLLADFTSAIESIADVRDTFESDAEFYDQVQLILRVNSGMDLHDFRRFLRFHERRFQDELSQSDTPSDRKNLIQYNLDQIASAVHNLKNSVQTVNFDKDM